LTTAARNVLKDCHLALEMMELETDPHKLRVLWIGALSLIRLVGDVLGKIDSDAQPSLKPVIDAHWKSLRAAKDPMFEKFIKGSRDRAIHRYDIDLIPIANVDVFVTDSGAVEFVTSLDDCLFSPMVGDFRTGDDARDVYRDALSWWDKYLIEIESRQS
jgi:hypothetical protein